MEIDCVNIWVTTTKIGRFGNFKIYFTWTWTWQKVHYFKAHSMDLSMVFLIVLLFKIIGEQRPKAQHFDNFSYFFCFDNISSCDLVLENIIKTNFVCSWCGHTSYTHLMHASGKFDDVFWLKRIKAKITKLFKRYLSCCEIIRFTLTNGISNHPTKSNRHLSAD